MKTYTKANKLNTISMLTLLWLGSFGVFGQVAQYDKWKWQNPLPSGNDIRDASFIDSHTGWVVGAKGSILKTTDGGATWVSQISGYSDILVSVHFYNAQFGVAVAAYGAIIKTTDGGNHWTFDYYNNSNFDNVQIIDPQNVWAVGSFATGTCKKSTNGGNTWTDAQVPNNNYINLQFIDNQTGWLTAESGIILKTIDGGSTWTPQVCGSQNAISLIHFVDDQNGWVSDGYDLYKTSDGGSTWIMQNTITPSYIVAMVFIDQQNGLLCTSDGFITRTINGGNSWSSIGSFNENFTTMIATPDHSIWIFGYGGGVYKSANNGSTFVNQRFGTRKYLSSIFFADPNTGWIVGNAGTILKTTNQGNTWVSQNSKSLVNLISVHFINLQSGWAVGVQGTILKTTDGGTTWLPQNSGVTSNINSIWFNNDQTGWASTYGKLLKTTNGGATWTSQTTGNPNNHYYIRFTDGQHGWGIVGGSNVIKTTNGGSSWTVIITGLTNSVTTAFFADSVTGWVVNGKNLLKTSNGGTTWINQTTGFFYSISAIYFVNNQIGWITSSDGDIKKTIDGGLTWTNQTSCIKNFLSSLFSLDGLTAFAVGAYGAIITNNNQNVSIDTKSTLLTGTIFQNGPSDCIQDSTSKPIPFQLVKGMPGEYYGISNNQGKYNLRLPLSDTATPFTIQAVENQNPAFNVEAVCPPNSQYNILLDTIPDTLSNKDFGFEITPCHHLDVQLGSNRRRRCFQNTTSISFQNQGSLSAPDAYLLVEFPHWVRPVSASRSHVAVNDSVWRFNLDSVSAGESGSFTITDSVICGNLEILGLSQCTKATIFPAPDCPPPAGYNGAEVTVSGKCNDGFVSLGIYNKSNTNMADSVNYWVYLDSIQVKQAKVKLAAGDSLKLWVETQGWAVHLTVNQVQNHPTELFVSTTVESCGDTFIFYPRQTVNRFAKQQTPSSKTHCLEIRGAYDPNDKQAFPIGFTNQNIIPPNTQLEYLIRFQNTGNDTAFTVYVIDTLDTDLNPETIELGAASHNYQLSMQTVKSGKTFLRWQFNNIQLPDSNVNEPASNGFIQYRISPKPNLSLGSKVKNHAEIYFDFNPPIITNQTLTTYNVITFRDTSLNNNVQIVTASKGKLSPKQIGVNLYPNPVTEHSLTADFQTKGSLTLFNAQGQLVFEKLNIEGKQVLPIQLRTGFYMAQLRTEKGVSVVKVVVE